MNERAVAPAATAPGLGPIEQTPLKVQVADRLRRAIITGALRPGTVLVETVLAERLIAEHTHALASFDPASVVDEPS